MKAIKHLLQHAVPIMRKDNPAAEDRAGEAAEVQGPLDLDGRQIATYRKHSKRAPNSTGVRVRA